MSDKKKFLSSIIGIWAMVVVGIAFSIGFISIGLLVTEEVAWDPPNWLTLVLEIGIGVGIAASILSYEKIQKEKSNKQQEEISKLIREVKGMEEKQTKIINEQIQSLYDTRKYFEKPILWRVTRTVNLCERIAKKYEKLMNESDFEKETELKHQIRTNIEALIKVLEIDITPIKLIEIFNKEISNKYYNLVNLSYEMTSLDLEQDEIDLVDLIDIVKELQTNAYQFHAVFTSFVEEHSNI